jgi:hypothetical protein
MINTSITNKHKENNNLNDLALKFASKSPKETNFNNSKSGKYFASENKSNLQTIKDSLLYSNHSDSVSTTSKQESFAITLKEEKDNTKHKRGTSRVLLVSKEIVILFK